MASILIRTAIVYILLSFSMRIMGKRQIGELDIGELVSTFLISEIVAIPIDDPDIPLLNAVLPIMLILSLEVILSAIKNKSEKMKCVIEGVPTYIIYKGKLLQSALKESRISVNELMSAMRAQGISDIDEVYYAIVEQTGTLSVIKRDDTPMAHAIIIDGEVIVDTLRRLGYDEKWLKKRLGEAGVGQGEVFLMTSTDCGETKIIKKEGEG